MTVKKEKLEILEKDIKNCLFNVFGFGLFCGKSKDWDDEISDKISDIDNQETQLNNPNITIDKTQEAHTPKLFSDENNHADDQSDYYKEEEVSERLFDQDVNEEEDFEIPAFLRRQKF